MIKVLIIGKKSFIGSNLYIFLKKKIYVKKISFVEIKRKNSKFFKNFSHIINCSVNPNYIKLRYNVKFDNDLKIVIKDGRYGIYVTNGKVNVTLSKDLDYNTVDLNMALDLISKKKPKKRFTKK